MPEKGIPDVDASITVRRPLTAREREQSTTQVRAVVINKMLHFLAEVHFKSDLCRYLEENPHFAGWDAGHFPVITYPTKLSLALREEALEDLIKWVEEWKYPVAD